MLASALTETLGLGMTMPLLEVIATPNNSSGSVQYLSPILKHFPDYYMLMVICGLLVVIAFIKSFFFILQLALSVRFVTRFQKLWASGIIEKYMYAEYPFLLSQKQGTVLNNLLNEPAKASKSLQQIIDFFSRVILSFFLYSLLLFANWKITLLITFVFVIIITLMRKITYNYSMGVGHKKLTLSQQLTAHGAENINAIRQIKTFSLESETCKKFTEKLTSLIHIIVKFRIIHRLPRPITESLVMVGIVFILLYLSYVSKVQLSNIIPIIGLFIITSQRLFPIVSDLFSQRMNILSFIPSLKLVHELYVSSVDREELDKGVVIDQIRGDIIFEHLHFSYHRTKPLFQGLNVRILKGKVTAIVGPSGSGKSTIVDLLVGFFRQQKGKILINGIDLKEINLQSWRKLIGYVSQDTFLFNTSVRENILVGKPDASEEEIIAAAIKANADRFIRDLPKRYDTVLGDRGLKISGGQRQRIAIARAIIRDPEVLIFDEATSSLDMESEKLIQESIDGLSSQKTVIIISHRLSTVKNADVIYVLDKGHIVESGTFEELENNKGRFFKMQTA
jgi:ABC-type multidrug transport system fused ATPase/permease subunit